MNAQPLIQFTLLLRGVNLLVKDDFMNSFGELKKHIKSATFNSVENDVDGAVYPSICLDIPSAITEEFIFNIEKEAGFKIKPNLIFLRSNPLGASEPYQAHNDLNMGDYTAILYINPVGGTSFVKHIETGMLNNDERFFSEWQKDCNTSDKWSIEDYCKGKENRVLLFESALMHRGEPVEGSGEGNEARMIMVCFYEKY